MAFSHTRFSVLFLVCNLYVCATTAAAAVKTTTYVVVGGGTAGMFVYVDWTIDPHNFYLGLALATRRTPSSVCFHDPTIIITASTPSV
jgi:hypothetical protein